MSSSYLPPPPLSLLEGAALFLDFDGTLVELADTPDAITVPETLGPLLGQLSERLDGRLALVSGRGISDLEKYVNCASIAMSGSHGLELRAPGGEIVAPPLPPALIDAVKAIQDFAAVAEGIIVENKSMGVALHYRKAPDMEANVLSFMRGVAEKAGLAVQHGKMMTELRPHGADKGDAVRAFMTEPKFMSARPIFVGDDLTDEAAFVAAAALGGGGALVGPPRETAALWRFDGVAAVARWLTDFVEETA
ncbi:trehalose-phosphatase [Allosphingosinicella flava]|uniref:Trehalose 6-phosphate phosphatase n=1 Tax=Allosphingosinicella flava TaxID=2771430 RepID=A0A7T2GM18_9SPHN|nr:trehalose-phosphatase [Sphingosinicella flava]QPQ56013.1 trehalose-phosphatase [Sphingosinicella flava]